MIIGQFGLLPVAQLQSEEIAKLEKEFTYLKFDENRYVVRPFATLEDLSKKMKNKNIQAVLYFTGPSGTGKTTTLKELCSYMKCQNLNVNCLYINAKADELNFPAVGAYIFVDEAQCLREKPRLCKNLESAKALCFAFSPIIATKEGCSINQCSIHFIKIYNFRPFSKRR